MKRLLYISAVLLFGMTACTEDTITYINPIPGEEPSGVIAELSVSSKNTWFTSEDELNAAVGFKSLGGEVVVDIQTNVAWKYTVTNGEWLTVEKDDAADQLILSCGSNKAEEAHRATISIAAADKSVTITATQNPYGTLEIQASQNNFRLPAVGELTAEFDVQSTDENWVFETAECPWMLLTKDGGKITIALDPNEETTDRETTFRLIAGRNAENPVTETVRVTQDRAVFINVSLKTVPFSPTPTEEQSLSVKSNFDWEWSVSENSDWLAVAKTEQGLTFSAETNPGETSRSATITITAGDGKENCAEQTVTVSQSGLDLNAFILGILVDKKNLSTYLPFDKAIEASIDWGDGTIEEHVTSPYPQHTYTDAGYYIVSVKGSVPSINSYSIPTYGLGKQFIEVYSWGRTGIRSMQRAFQNCSELKRIPSDNTRAFAEVTDFSYAFSGCGKLEEIPEGLFAYAAGITTLQCAFDNCDSITSAPADLLYNCPKLTSVQSLFRGTSLTSIDEDFFSHNTELTDASIIFSSGKLKTVPAKLFANNPRITTFNSLFANSPSFETVPAELFANNPAVTTFRMVFQGSGLKEIPDGLFSGNPAVTNFQSAFSKTSVHSIPADLFSGCDRVTTFRACFSGCTQLQNVPADLFRKSGAMSTATEFYGIFQDCSSLTEIPAGIFDGFAKVSEFSNAFNGCTSLQTLPAGLFATNTAVTKFANVFGGCTSLRNIPEGMLSGLNRVTSFSGLFSGCTGIEEIGPDMLAGCNALTNISSMFKGCSNLRTVSADAFAGAVRITSIASLFENCTQLEQVPEGIFDDLTALTTATNVFAGSGIRTVPARLFARNVKVSSFSKLFMGCASLTELPDGLFASNSAVTTYTSAIEACPALERIGVLFGPNTKAAKCDRLFAECAALKSIPSGIFDGLTGATTFLNAFLNCTALETIPAGLFARNSAVTTVATCFKGCTSLKSVPSQLFEANTKTKTLTEMFSGCSSIESIAADAFAGLDGTSLNFQKTFLDCTSLREIPDGLFKSTNISTYTSLFAGCTGLLRVGSEVFNCASATTLSSVFDGCTSLQTVGEKMLIEPVKLTATTNLFRNCTSLKSVPANIFDEAVKLKTLTSTFQNCSSLEGESPFTVIGGVKYHLYERTAENAAATGFVAITGSKNCFTGCTKLSDYDKIPAAWKE